jgi:hypothetical protein
MKKLMSASLRRSMVAGAMVLTGSLLVSTGPALRAEDNGDGPVESECPTWKTCDARCGATPPVLDGSPEADAAFDAYQECTNKCLREVFDCITQQASLPPVDGGVLDPGDPVLDRGHVILPENVLDTVLEQTIVYLEPGQLVSSADTNGDEVVNMSDALLIFNYLFSGGAAPWTIMIGGYVRTETSPQLSADGLRLIIDGNLVLTSGDTDASGSLDMVDPLRILNHLFSDGKQPVEIWTRPLRLPPIDDLPDRLPPIDRLPPEEEPDPLPPIDRFEPRLPPIDVIAG